MSATARPEWFVRRWLHVERWRFAIGVHAFRGNGLPNFECSFAFGFPRHSPATVKRHAWLFDVEPDDAAVRVGVSPPAENEKEPTP